MKKLCSAIGSRSRACRLSGRGCYRSRSEGRMNYGAVAGQCNSPDDLVVPRQGKVLFGIKTKAEQREQVFGVQHRAVDRDAARHVGMADDLDAMLLDGLAGN